MLEVATSAGNDLTRGSCRFDSDQSEISRAREKVIERKKKILKKKKKEKDGRGLDTRKA